MTNEITQADRDLLRQAYEQEGYLTLPDFLLHDTAPILVERVALRAIAAARRQGQTVEPYAYTFPLYTAPPSAPVGARPSREVAEGVMDLSPIFDKPPTAGEARAAIGRALDDAAKAVRVLSTMLKKQKLMQGYAVADEILGSIGYAQKLNSALAQQPGGRVAGYWTPTADSEMLRLHIGELSEPELRAARAGYELAVRQAVPRHLTTPAAPEGMVLVPREPTEAMCNAAWRDLESQGIEPENVETAQIYRAMLAAAGETASA